MHGTGRKNESQINTLTCSSLSGGGLLGAFVKTERKERIKAESRGTGLAKAYGTCLDQRGFAKTDIEAPLCTFTAGGVEWSLPFPPLGKRKLLLAEIRGPRTERTDLR